MFLPAHPTVMLTRLGSVFSLVLKTKSSSHQQKESKERVLNLAMTSSWADRNVMEPVLKELILMETPVFLSVLRSMREATVSLIV